MINNLITIVIPCFNEQNNIIELVKRLELITKEIKDIEFTYLFIDDGSTDNTFEILKNYCFKLNKIKAIQLSRNFGSHISISAGIENAVNSDAVIVISADLQEPPELINKLLEKWKEGYDVVWSIREKRAQSLLGRSLSKTFYKFFIKGSGLKNYPKEGPSALFLLDKKVCMQWRKFKETNRMIIGMVVWMGFKHISISYKQKDRHSGKSSYNFNKLLKLAIDSFVSFSSAPIRLISIMGILISFLGFIYAIILVFNKLIFGIGPTGWTTIMVVVLFLGGIQLITLGIIGEYVWRGTDESRNRPLYIIKDKVNLED